ncbi:MAG: succinate dehydrogenase cytochrome b subunit [Bacteroidota bacterium]
MINSALIKSSIGKKLIMGLTGFFLITFLIVHASINGCIWFNDGGVTFLFYAHFMGTNFIVHFLEVGLFAGLILHIVDGLLLWKQNRDARPVKYAYSNPNANSKWYSRSMGLLGTLILFFLIIHLRNFWGPNRLNQLATGEELNLFQLMQEHFQSPGMVIFYLVACFSLFWHLLHGFKSAFQSLGLNNVKYNKAIEVAGIAFSVIISIVFALMPVSFYFNLVH